MSTFDQDPSRPPPPPQAPFGAPAAPPPSSAYPPAYNPGGQAPPGYAPFAGAPVKPPRPAVTVGSLFLVVGGVLLIVGSVLNWFTIEGTKYNGFAGDGGDTKDGPVFVFFAVLLIGFGIAQLAAKRVLAVAILAVVFASFSILAALADVGNVGDAIDLANGFGISASRGPGLWVVLLGSLVALGGGIATLSKRRR